MKIWPHKHIHTLANFSIQDYESVFELADKFDALKNAGTKKIPALQGTLVHHCFLKLVQEQRIALNLQQKDYRQMYKRLHHPLVL